MQTLCSSRPASSWRRRLAAAAVEVAVEVVVPPVETAERHPWLRSILLR